MARRTSWLVVALLLGLVVAQDGVQDFTVEFLRPEHHTPRFDAETGEFVQIIRAPLITDEWTERGLPLEENFGGVWKTACEPFNGNPDSFSTRAELTICRKKLRYVRYVFNKTKDTKEDVCRPMPPNCTGLCGPVGVQQFAFWFEADIKYAKADRDTLHEFKLTLEPTVFIVRGPVLPPGCSGTHTEWPDRDDRTFASSSVTNILHGECGNWWVHQHRVYTSIRLAFNHGHTTGTGSLEFGDVVYADPEHEYTGVPGSNYTERLILHKDNRLGNRFHLDADDSPERFCDREDTRYLPKGLIWVALGKGYTPEKVCDFGTSDSVDPIEFWPNVTCHTLVAPQVMGSLATHDEYAVFDGDRDNFILWPPGHGVLYSPLRHHPRHDDDHEHEHEHDRGHGIVRSVRPAPDHSHWNHSHPLPFVDYEIRVLLSELLEERRPDSHEPLVSVIKDTHGRITYSFWISVNLLIPRMPPDHSETVSVNVRFTIQIDRYQTVVHLGDSRVDSLALFVDAQDLQGEDGHCPEDWARMVLKWRLKHRKFQQGFGLDHPPRSDDRYDERAGIMRADQIFRSPDGRDSVGGCYGFPATTNHNQRDPIDPGWDRHHSDAQEDELMLAFDPHPLHPFPRWDKRSWNPENSSICNTLDGRAQRDCLACTICHAQEHGYCRKWEHEVSDDNNNRDEYSQSTVPLTGSDLIKCILHCKQNILPDICYVSKPGHHRTVLVGSLDCGENPAHEYCEQDIEIHSDCFPMRHSDEFYAQCPQSVYGGERDELRRGRYAFNYDTTVCRSHADIDGHPSVHYVDHTCYTANELVRSHAEAFPRHPVIAPEKTEVTCDVPLDVEMFGLTTDHWEQNLAHRFGYKNVDTDPRHLAHFPITGAIAVGVRTHQHEQLDRLPIRILDVTICRIKLSRVWDILRYMFDHQEWQTVRVAKHSCLDADESIGVLDGYEFLHDGRDTHTCRTAPDHRTCVENRFLPKVNDDFDDFTARAPDHRLFMCRKETAAQFKPFEEFNNHQYVGCDAVALSAATVVSEIGEALEGQGYIIEMRIEMDCDARNIGDPPEHHGRRLLSMHATGPPPGHDDHRHDDRDHHEDHEDHHDHEEHHEGSHDNDEHGHGAYSFVIDVPPQSPPIINVDVHVDQHVKNDADSRNSNQADPVNADSNTADLVDENSNTNSNSNSNKNHHNNNHHKNGGGYWDENGAWHDNSHNNDDGAWAAWLIFVIVFFIIICLCFALCLGWGQHKHRKKLMQQRAAAATVATTTTVHEHRETQGPPPSAPVAARPSSQSAKEVFSRESGGLVRRPANYSQTGIPTGAVTTNMLWASEDGIA